MIFPFFLHNQPPLSLTSLPALAISYSNVACFAMTINKAQEQTFQEVGVDLSTSCFTHAMLYMALSRVRSPSKLSVYTENGTTKNVVILRQYIKDLLSACNH